ncbi:hypothetical protein HNQ80_005158 [Anaerosolibacter carboniphilus]|uniref:Uncharacterized protein n=1 Tax=Anaerosolibacter carboniphilus TaxID=1417629 RepID=A0A841L486_9FIRM|nr:hypothetical protein [Anaerosolibacter carboniphilus]MBB6218980.1 hypothetical protein [Anaerosolibacter carboniphilus]
MCKVIELDKYKKNQTRKDWRNIPLYGPVWFYELNDGIKQLARKDAAIIVQNIKEHLSCEYYHFLEANSLDSKQYTIEQYIAQHINVNDPFSISHSIQFSRGANLKIISENDWNNISDMIIRISILDYYNLLPVEVEPVDLVSRYFWDSIKIDISK